MIIDKPGLYEIDDDTYHADPCPTPSLSSTIAKVLLNETPRHAWMKHPRLNPAMKSAHKKEFDLGSTAHKHMLGSGSDLIIVDAADWRTKAAKEAREGAYADGNIPLLPHQAESVQAMVTAGRAQLAMHQDAADAFTNGKPEQTLIWQEGEIWCRCKLDWLPYGGNVFDDYKSTGQSANPEDLAKTIFNLGYDVQAAFYMRGIRAVLGIKNPIFRFVFQETEPPYALSVAQIGPASMDVAARKAEQAIQWWKWCIRRDVWPGYPSRTAHVEAPAYAETKWLDREDRELILRENGEDLFQIMLDWQAPHNKEAAE